MKQSSSMWTLTKAVRSIAQPTIRCSTVQYTLVKVGERRCADCDRLQVRAVRHDKRRVARGLRHTVAPRKRVASNSNRLQEAKALQHEVGDELETTVRHD